MILTAENYYSREADREYLSVSQYKNFTGSAGIEGCEARALAKLDGAWTDEKGIALLVGSYVDCHFEGNLPLFKAQNPEIFTKQGSLKAEYKRAEEIINRIERDDYFMKFMSGEKQTIMTGKIGGVDWKIKMDSYLPDVYITDLKIVESIRKKFFAKGKKMQFIENWGYDIQAAVYQEIVRQNTGKRLPFYIAAASKEREPDIEIIQIEDHILDEKLFEIENNIDRIMLLKEGLEEPKRCEKCDYCKFTKKLSKPILSTDLLMEVFNE